METDTNAPAPSAPVRKSAWKQKAHHTVTLPSGAVVKMKILSLPALLKAGDIPNPLLPIAKAHAGAGKLEDDMIDHVPDFQAYLVTRSVVEPALENEDVLSTTDGIPYQDVEMICDITLRLRDMDAIGHQIGGLETLEEFRRFRGLSDGLEGLED